MVHFNEQYVDEETGEAHRHCGIDISGEKGDRVVASAPGKVFYVGYTPTGGKTISIVHLLDVKTTYLNLQDYHVSVGQEVKRGQIIGTIGAEDDPSSEEIHLHFGVIVNDHYVDPEKILNMDFNDLTKFISLTYTELDENNNVGIKSNNIYGEKAEDIFKLNENSDIKNINLASSNFKNITSKKLSFWDYIFKTIYWDDDFDKVYDWNDPDDNNNNILDIHENRDHWKWNNFIDFDGDNDGIVDWNDPDDDNNLIDDKYETSNPIDLTIYTDFGKDKIEKSLKSIIHNKSNNNKDKDYKIVVPGYCSETYDVLNSDLTNFLENNGYSWSKMAYFSCNGPGTYHNGYDSQGSYIDFKNSMIKYLNKIPEKKEIDLIGFSQGGRLIMEFVTDKNNKSYMDKIDQVITINSPIKGANSFLAKASRDPWFGKLIGFLLPDKSSLPFPEIDPDLPASFNLDPKSYVSKKLSQPDIYGDRNEDGSLYRPDVEIINIGSKNDLVVEDFGIDSQVYKYTDNVYVNSNSPLFSHYFNLKSKFLFFNSSGKYTFNLILNLLNGNEVDGEIKNGYIIYGGQEQEIDLEYNLIYEGGI
ncbi:MAG: M23 family metallopeptidase [Actinomycetota bacterium]